MMLDLKEMRSKLDEKNSEIMQSEVLELLAYAEKLEAVAHWARESITSDLFVSDHVIDALRAAGWEI
jgi:hypothetical protein